jgi:hypothetical protein
MLTSGLPSPWRLSRCCVCLAAALAAARNPGEGVGTGLGLVAVRRKQRHDLVSRHQNLVRLFLVVDSLLGFTFAVVSLSLLARTDGKLGGTQSLRARCITAIRAVIESSILSWTGILVVAFTASYGFSRGQGVSATVSLFHTWFKGGY